MGRQARPKHVQTLRIGGFFPSLNEWIEYAKRHPGKYSRKKRSETVRVMWIAKAQKLTHCTRPVTLNFHFCEPNKRRDMDNIAAGAIKPILDGLVEAGVLTDDSQKHIWGWSVSFDCDPEDPHVEVTIKQEEL